MDILTPNHRLWPIFVRRLRNELRQHPQSINISRVDQFLVLNDCYVRGKIQSIGPYEYINKIVRANKTEYNCLMRIDAARSLKIIYELERDYNVVFDINNTIIFFRQFGVSTDVSVLRNVEKRYNKKIRKKIVLVNSQGIGDMVALTASIRDLKLTYPHLELMVLTSNPDVCLNNPYIKATSSIIDVEDENIEIYLIDFRVPFWDFLQDSYAHFLGSYHKSVIYETGLSFNSSSLLPDLHLTTQEINLTRQKFNLKKPYWIINSGYRAPSPGIDGTLKWWGTDNYQTVVDILKDKMNFVQIGGQADCHTELKNTTSLIGKTNIRELMCLIYDSNGTIGPISGHIHIAAAFNKPSVVIGGGFEHPSLTMYPKQRNINSIGLLSCCRDTGCWTGHAAVDCNNKQDGVCECMRLIKPEQVIKDIQHIIDIDKL